MAYIKTSDNRVFQEIQIKISILNMEKEHQFMVDVESFSKENTFILVEVVQQITDSLVQQANNLHNV